MGAMRHAAQQHARKVHGPNANKNTRALWQRRGLHTFVWTKFDKAALKQVNLQSALQVLLHKENPFADTIKVIR